MIVRELLTVLGFKTDDAEVKKYDNSMAGLAKTIGAVYAVAATAATAAAGFAASVAGGIDDMADFAAANDVALESMQELGYAAQLNGSSLEAVKSTISGMNKTLGEAAQGLGRGAKLFENLGLSAKNADGSTKSYDQLLAELSDKFATISRQEQIAIADKIGIDRSLLSLLSKGSAEMERLRQEAREFGLVTDADADKAGGFNDSMDRMSFLLSGVGRRLAVGL
jgi:hypothetical protein